jgi:hypothetical protein
MLMRAAAKIAELTYEKNLMLLQYEVKDSYTFCIAAPIKTAWP